MTVFRFILVCLALLSSAGTVFAQGNIDAIKEETQLLKAKIDNLKAKNELRALSTQPEKKNLISITSAELIHNSGKCDATGTIQTECSKKEKCTVPVDVKICSLLQRQVLRVNYKCGSEELSIDTPIDSNLVLYCK